MEGVLGTNIRCPAVEEKDLDDFEAVLAPRTRNRALSSVESPEEVEIPLIQSFLDDKEFSSHSLFLSVAFSSSGMNWLDDDNAVEGNEDPAESSSGSSEAEDLHDGVFRAALKSPLSKDGGDVWSKNYRTEGTGCWWECPPITLHVGVPLATASYRSASARVTGSIVG